MMRRYSINETQGKNGVWEVHKETLKSSSQKLLGL